MLIWYKSVFYVATQQFSQSCVERGVSLGQNSIPVNYANLRIYASELRKEGSQKLVDRGNRIKRRKLWGWTPPYRSIIVWTMVVVQFQYLKKTIFCFVGTGVSNFYNMTFCMECQKFASIWMIKTIFPFSNIKLSLHAHSCRWNNFQLLFIISCIVITHQSIIITSEDNVIIIIGTSRSSQ